MTAPRRTGCKRNHSSFTTCRRRSISGARPPGTSISSGATTTSRSVSAAARCGSFRVGRPSISSPSRSTRWRTTESPLNGSSSWVSISSSCSPLHGWDAHTTSMPRPPAFDVGELARQPVATFGVLAPAGLQGFGPSLSQALATALAEAAPSVRGIPALETVNALNEQGLAAEYADLIAGFLRNGILERKRLQRIGSALRARYVLLPGL